MNKLPLPFVDAFEPDGLVVAIGGGAYGRAANNQGFAVCVPDITDVEQFDYSFAKGRTLVITIAGRVSERTINTLAHLLLLNGAESPLIAISEHKTRYFGETAPRAALPALRAGLMSDREVTHAEVAA